MPRTFTLKRTQLIPRALQEVFPFFSDAKNLERIFDYRFAKVAELLG